MTEYKLTLKRSLKQVSAKSGEFRNIYEARESACWMIVSQKDKDEYSVEIEKIERMPISNIGFPEYVETVSYWDGKYLTNATSKDGWMDRQINPMNGRIIRKR